MTIMTFVGKQPDKGNTLRCDNPQESCFPFSSGGGGVESVVPMDTRVEKSRSVKLLFRETYSVGSTGSHVILLPKLNTQLIHQNRS